MRFRPLRELNQATVAVVGSLLIAAVVLFAVSFAHFPFIARVSTYHAEFADAAGLAFGHEVRLAGLHFGENTPVQPEGPPLRATLPAH